MEEEKPAVHRDRIIIESLIESIKEQPLTPMKDQVKFERPPCIARNTSESSLHLLTENLNSITHASGATSVALTDKLKDRLAQTPNHDQMAAVAPQTLVIQTPPTNNATKHLEDDDQENLLD